MDAQSLLSLNMFEHVRALLKNLQWFQSRWHCPPKDPKGDFNGPPFERHVWGCAIYAETTVLQHGPLAPNAGGG